MSYSIIRERSSLGYGRTSSRQLENDKPGYLGFFIDNNGRCWVYDRTAALVALETDLRISKNADGELLGVMSEGEFSHCIRRIIENNEYNYCVVKNHINEVHTFVPEVDSEEQTIQHHNQPVVRDKTLIVLSSEDDTLKVFLRQEGLGIEFEVRDPFGHLIETMVEPTTRIGDVQILSGDSQLFQVLLGKHIGDTVVCAGEEYVIKEISDASDIHGLN